MKQFLFAIPLVFLAISCNNQEKEAQVKSASTETAEASPAYAYTIEHPDQWEWGSKENTRIALQALKDFETGSVDKCLDGFGDSVEVRFDQTMGKVSHDSLGKMLKAMRDSRKTIEIKMHDFETVRSKDGSEEWVTMWYTEKWEDLQGKWDSVSFVNDLRFKNGKIIVLDEKMRRFPPAK